MRTAASLLALLLTACAPSPDGVGASTAALGEPTDGFPSWEERVVHVWTNRARQDPAADLAACGSDCAEAACYAPRPPLVWNHELARAARFHSDNLARAGCSLQHDSPCTLVADLGSRYTPGSCNGDPSCACQGGSATCGSEGTSFGARIGLFTSGARAENIATGSDPVTTFYRWLHERDTNPACGWRIANGHRANILGDARAIGVGKTTAGGVWTQDFTSSGTPDGVVSGVHYPATGASLAFRANWYRSGRTPTSAQVNVGGACHAMSLERGAGDNGTYLATVTGVSGCVRYVFTFEDGASTVTFPTTGSYGVGCAADWEATRPPACGCTPACGARTCGDDGCGGSCGTCAADRTCSGAGQCVCSSGTDCGGSCVDTSTDEAHCGGCGDACGGGETCVGGACTSSCTPDCGGASCGDDGCGGSCGTCAGGESCVDGTCTSSCAPDCGGASCGDDGCGGSCGTCPGSRTCQSGACVCPSGRTDCGGSCVDTAVDPNHCGGCGSACGASEACVGGSCACVPRCDGRSCGDDGCGGSCGTCGADRLCADGSCVCLGAATECAGACVDVRVDEAHCGACGVACAPGEVCVASACVPAGADAGVCAPACDGRACGDDTCGGTCGECAEALVCGGGQCLCDGAARLCDGACTDVRDDAVHCGACGVACASDQRCVGGECVGGEVTPDAATDAGVDAGRSSDVLRGVAWGCRAAPSDRGSAAWTLLALLALARRRRR